MHLSYQQLCSKVSSHEIFPECDPPACLWIAAIPFTTAWVWLGQGGRGTKKNTQKTPKHQSSVLCVCVCVQSPTGPCLPEVVSPSCWNQSFGKQDCPRCPGLSHLFKDPFSSWGGKKRHPGDSEGTLQYPTEKGIRQQMGFLLMVVFNSVFRLWGVNKIPFNLHSSPCCPEYHPYGEQGDVLLAPNLFILYSWRRRQKSTKSHGNVLWRSP